MSNPRAAGRSEGAEPDDRARGRGYKAEQGEGGPNESSLLKQNEKLFPEQGGGQLARRIADERPNALTGKSGRQGDQVALANEPQRGHGQQRGDRRPNNKRGHTKRPRLGSPSHDGVARGDMPRHEDRHPRHHPVRKTDGGGKMRELLQRFGNGAGLLDLPPAAGALTDVRAEGGQAKAPLAVDEEINLVGK